MTDRVGLTLGPLLYNWPADRRLEFYRTIAAEAPFDTVVLGEVVCAKRAPFAADVTLEAARLLEEAGKIVVMAAPSLPVTGRERAELASVAKGDDQAWLPEANEAGALFFLHGRPHRIGPFFNTYNGETLRVLVAGGATAVCLPWDLDLSAVARIAEAGTDVCLEVPVFGSIPLAISARCAHARAHGLAKDGCRYVCEQDPEGMPVATLDGQEFLRVNGTQTLSHAILLLARELPDLVACGVSAVRVMPEAVDMAAVGRIYRDLLDDRLEPAEAETRLRAHLGARTPANGFLHGRSGATWALPTRAG